MYQIKNLGFKLFKFQQKTQKIKIILNKILIKHLNNKLF